MDHAMRRSRISGSLVVLLLALGCAAAPVTPAGDPHIVGVITWMDGDTIRVEENPNESIGSPKASVRITPETSVTTVSGVRGSADELQVGTRVRVWFTGPVAESYPLQARAAAVVIERD